jgi:hypothetical protein
MINVSEFRRYNTYSINGEIKQAWDLYRDHLNVVVDFHTQEIKGDHIGDIDPIPLTPEWLERCGFVKLVHLGRNEYSLWIDEVLTIETLFILNNRTEEIVVRIVTTNENDDENIPLGAFVTYKNVNCKYLHQLQNLYFALTGEELQIKLP